MLVKETLGESSRYRHLPKVVVAEVMKRAGVQFSLNLHACAWKYFKVRPSSSTRDRTTDKQYCAWVEGAERYLYTEEWIVFLARQVAKSEVYEAIKRSRD